ncbi:hypothetical protein [Phenylobacterium sp. J367]|uniref:hypothetical protein n=1 Tax=Phenylobacterium sp. J367 TaxID=2898435 RepID=UPI0021510713|nr:hypothetical protein [Phenylobacterium sp. J367]MCR5880980.1 hypothetical protein [Phenylobacterium sp. J367]
MDWSKPLLGIGIAAASGLLLGGAMKPDLGAGDRPEGPQIFAGWSGARSTGPFDDGRTLAYVEGQLPDYVVGTDWKTVAWQEGPEPVEVAPAAEASAFDAAAHEPVQYAAARWEEPPPEAPSYPSLSGGVRYDHARPAEAAPPPPPAFDEEVMPEATGDTTVIVEG